jgi:hypothetical protein
VGELLHRQLVWRGGCSFDSAIASATSLRFHGGHPAAQTSAKDVV